MKRRIGKEKRKLKEKLEDFHFIYNKKNYHVFFLVSFRGEKSCSKPFYFFFFTLGWWWGTGVKMIACIEKKTNRKLKEISPGQSPHQNPKVVAVEGGLL
jgi:hypothetical protein